MKKLITIFASAVLLSGCYVKEPTNQVEMSVDQRVDACLVAARTAKQREDCYITEINRLDPLIEESVANQIVIICNNITMRESLEARNRCVLNEFSRVVEGR